MRNDKIIITLCIFFLALLFANSHIPAPLANFHAANLRFIGNQSPLQVTGPIKINNLNDVIQAKSLLFDFDFKTFDLYYDNLFQIGDSVSALRMEITPPSTLTLIYGQGASLVLSDNIQTNILYHVHLHTDFSDNLVVEFQGKKKTVNHDKLAPLTYDFSEFTLGTGFNKLRPLQGEIHNANVSLIYSQETTIKQIIRFFLGLIIGIVGILILLQRKQCLPNKKIFYPESLLTVLAYTGWGLSFSLMASGLALLSHGSKWIPHCVFLFSYFALIFAPLKLRGTFLNYVQRNSWFFALFSIVSFLIFCVATTLTNFNYYPISLYTLLILAIIIPLFITTPVIRFYKQAPIVLFLGGLELLVWMSLFDLPNWVGYVSQIKSSYSSFFSGLIAFFIALFFVFSEKPDKALKYSSIKLMCYGIDVFAILVFLWLSFRFDTLFLGSSELHWEYFAGPIRVLKHGGWLLWDTPSQYGFLNILLASLLPIKSSWQSMYVFQGLLLSITAITWYLVALKYTQNSLLNRIVGLLLIISGLFFADPDLIGPSLYPSSSVMRFFWCYMVMSCCLLMPMHQLKNILLTTVMWVFAVLWSTESAIYATCILFSALVAQFYLCIRTQYAECVSLFLRYFILPIVVLLCCITILVLFYQLRLGHFPDWHCFTEYALSYAAGFGSLDLKWNGPIVFLSILFIGLFHVYTGLESSKSTSSQVPIAAMMGCLWAVTTYYIGRAVANNVTAMLPLLGFIAYFSLLIIKEKSLGYYATILQFSAMPLLFLLLMTPLSLKGLNAIYHSKSFTPHIETQLLAPERRDAKELTQLMLNMKVTSKSLVSYYGASAAMPTVFLNGVRLINEKNWLSSPLQLLEEPITSQRRKTILMRYFKHFKKSGFLIQKHGETPERFQEWLTIIRLFYREDAKKVGQQYTIRHFSPK